MVFALFGGGQSDGYGAIYPVAHVKELRAVILYSHFRAGGTLYGEAVKQVCLGRIIGKDNLILKIERHIIGRIKAALRRRCCKARLCKFGDGRRIAYGHLLQLACVVGLFIAVILLVEGIQRSALLHSCHTLNGCHAILVRKDARAAPIVGDASVIIHDYDGNVFVCSCRCTAI